MAVILSAVTETAGQVDASLARFPAVDPEPPPRPWYSRAARAAGALGAAVLIAGAALAIARSVGHDGHQAASLSGSGAHVLTVSASGTLEVSDPSGGHVTPLPALGRYGNAPPSVSLDGRYLVAANGSLIAINGPRLVIVPTHAVPSARESPAAPDALADHDRALVLTTTPAGQVSVVSLATGGAVSLGVADAVAGDPQQPGAFVSVASGPTPPPAVAGVASGPPLIPDGRVELRDSGRRTVVLATTASLEQALGDRSRDPVALAPYPSPAGDRVAISVTDATGAGSSEGIVIVSRTGRIEAALPASLGPAPGGEPAWSPTGNTLAYGAPGLASSGLAVWTPGRPPVIRPDPTPGDQPVRCVWSPNGASIMCEMFLPGGTLDWDTAAADGGRIAAFAAPGPLLAWLRTGSS